jgi:SH3 domain-containing YSC84-like protein 1
VTCIGGEEIAKRDRPVYLSAAEAEAPAAGQRSDSDGRRDPIVLSNKEVSPVLNKMKRFCLCLFLLAPALVAARPAGALSEQEELIERSRLTFLKLIDHPDFPELKQYVHHSKAVLIVPSLIKGGFFIGGEGGSGVLVARTKEGGWSYPAFYTLGAGSLGIQFGGQVGEVVFTIMTENGLKAVLSNQMKLGVDASVAVGPIGKGLEASTTTNFRSDIYQFAKTEGLFGGGAFEGALIYKRDDWNRGLYGRNVSPQAIVLRNEVSHPSAESLRQALSGY